MSFLLGAVLVLIIATWGMVELTWAWHLARASGNWSVTWHFDQWVSWWPWVDGVLLHGALLAIGLGWVILWRRGKSSHSARRGFWKWQ